MTSYIGNTPGLANRLLWQFTASESQTVFTGVDDNNLNLNFASYVIDVYVNGVLLIRDRDYTTSNGNTITFVEGLSEDDSVVIIGVGVFNLADTYTRAEIDSFTKQKVFWRFIATENQTEFTGTDENSSNLDFTGFEVDVYVNGNLLTPTVDFTTSNNDTVTIATPLTEGDEVIIKL